MQGGVPLLNKACYEVLLLPLERLPHCAAAAPVGDLRFAAQARGCMGLRWAVCLGSGSERGRQRGSWLAANACDGGLRGAVLFASWVLRCLSLALCWLEGFGLR